MKKLTLTAAIAVVLAGALTACSKPNDNEPMNNNAQSSPAMMEQNNADTSVTRADSAETSLGQVNMKVFFLVLTVKGLRSS